MPTPPKIRIGTRGSPLALWQAEWARTNMAQSARLDKELFEIVVIESSGDKIQDKALRAFGGKGLFTKEIEEALLAKEIDVAVHSMKDMPTVLPDGLEIGAILPREDVRDAFISLEYETLADLPAGARVGTSSLRRKAQILALRPDLEVGEYRGNVQTRLRKLEEGVADATLLASAGLKRLGNEERITSLISTDEMLPAVAQGAIGVECRSEDLDMLDLLNAIDDWESSTQLEAERAFLATLDGSCHTPIAALAVINDKVMHFRGQILLPDGSESHEITISGNVFKATQLGYQAALDIRKKAGEDFMAKLHGNAS